MRLLSPTSLESASDGSGCKSEPASLPASLARRGLAGARKSLSQDYRSVALPAAQSHGKNPPPPLRTSPDILVTTRIKVREAANIPFVAHGALVRPRLG